MVAQPLPERLVLHDIAVLRDRLVLRLENRGSLELTLRVAIPDSPVTSEQRRSIRSRKGSRNPDRDRQIIEAYTGGAKLEEIGQRFGLTRQRVYQIVTRAHAERPYGNAFDRFVS